MLKNRYNIACPPCVQALTTHTSLASFLWDIGKQCRTRPDAASDQVLHYLLPECTFKILILKLTTKQTLNLKWVLPIEKGWKIPLGINGLGI